LGTVGKSSLNLAAGVRRSAWPTHRAGESANASVGGHAFRPVVWPSVGSRGGLSRVVSGH
jgi:hypothetical protein